MDLPTVIKWTWPIQILWFWGGIFTLKKINRNTVSKQGGYIALNWACTVCQAMSHNRKTIGSYGLKGHISRSVIKCVVRPSVWEDKPRALVNGLSPVPRE